MSIFEYACFISYRNGRRPDGLISEFAHQLSEALERVLDAFLYEETGSEENDFMVFLDRKVVGDGEFLPQRLGQSICRSFCWIVILTRHYLGGALWCASELFSMLELERQRLEALGLTSASQGFIIPVLLKGEVKDFPDLFHKRTINTDFKRFTLAVSNLESHEGFAHAVEALAETIADHQKLLMGLISEKNIDLCSACNEKKLEDVTGEGGKERIQKFISEMKAGRVPEFPFI